MMVKPPSGEKKEELKKNSKVCKKLKIDVKNKAQSKQVKPSLTAKPGSFAKTIVRHSMLGDKVMTGLAIPQRLADPEEDFIKIGVEDDGTFVDPYQASAKGNLQEKSDLLEIDFESKKCCTDDKYVSDSPGDAVMRISWCPPLAEITTASTPPKVDQRGLLTDVSHAEITFKNVTQDVIKIRTNTPRGYQGTNNNLVGTRSNNLSIDLKAGGSVVHRVGFKYNPYFQPLVYNVKDEQKLGVTVMALCDLVIIEPNISINSNTPYDPERKICHVTVKMVYDVSADPREGTISTFRKPYMIQKLPSVKALYTIDGVLTVAALGVSPSGFGFSPAFVTAELTGNKWMRIDAFHPSGKNSYGFRLVFCDRRGVRISDVQFREFQSSDYRLILPSDVCNWSQPESGTAKPTVRSFGITTFGWDNIDGCWMAMSGTEPMLCPVADKDFVALSEENRMLHSTMTPLIAFNVLPPRAHSKPHWVIKGGQKLFVSDGATGVITDFLKICDAVTKVVKIVSAVLSIFL